MTGTLWIAAGSMFATLATAIGVLLVALHAWRRDRNKPEIDKAQIEDVVKKTSRWRDARLAQYDRFWDEQDQPWHRSMTILMHQAQDGGFLPADAIIPPTPVMPEPPPYD